MSEPPSSLDPRSLQRSAGEIAEAAKLLANEVRLRLLSRLSQGEMRVGDLEAELGIHQPTLSQQLAVLRAKGAVVARRDGRRIFYGVSDRKLLKVVELLCGLYCRSEPDGERRVIRAAGRSDPRLPG